MMQQTNISIKQQGIPFNLLAPQELETLLSDET
jgi:hypothetical protein